MASSSLRCEAEWSGVRGDRTQGEKTQRNVGFSHLKGSIPGLNSVQSVGWSPSRLEVPGFEDRYVVFSQRLQYVSYGLGLAALENEKARAVRPWEF